MQQMITTDCCEAFAYSKALLVVLPPIFSALTWWVTQLATRRGEQRKEAKAEIVKLSGQVDSIYRNAYQHHCGAQEDANLTGEIHILLTILAQDLNRSELLKKETARHLIIGLRRAITLRNFDTNGFKTISRDHPLLKEISSACDQIKDALNAAFSIKYDSDFVIKW